MARVFLDTTVLIDYLRARPAVHARIEELIAGGDERWACAVNVEEVVRGLHERERAAADRLFRGLRVAPLSSREGWLAGDWRREYAQQGVTLSQADCLVAAAAVSVGARLATGNPKHFPMPGLTVEHWPAGV